MFIAGLLYPSVIQMFPIERFVAWQAHFYPTRMETTLHPAVSSQKTVRTPKLLISLYQKPFSVIHQISVYVCGLCLSSSSGLSQQHVGMIESFRQFDGISVKLNTKRISLMLCLYVNQQKSDTSTSCWKSFPVRRFHAIQHKRGWIWGRFNTKQGESGI